MESIDESKGDLKEGSYLTLCNLLKNLHLELSEIKSKKGGQLEEDDDNEEREREEEEEEQEDDFEQLIESFYNNQSNYNLNLNEQIERFNRIYFQMNSSLLDCDKYNHLLTYITNDQEMNDNNRWLICNCGCSVCFHDIQEHLETPEHKNNYQF